MAQKTKLPAGYENNPFTIAVSGISLLFDLAKGVAFLLVAFAVLNVFQGILPPADSTANENMFISLQNTIAGWTLGDWTFAIGASGIVILAVLLISALFGGVMAYTSLHLSRGETVGLGEAFRVAFERLWSFLWLQIIIFVKIVLWSLLLIVPGIIMATRYSLASVVFFDDKKGHRGNAAIQESIRLTRGAWITTYGANTLFNFITFGVITSIVTTGVNAVLYRQYDKLDENKPEAHLLSWLALVLPFALLLILILLGIFVLFVMSATGTRLFSE